MSKSKLVQVTIGGSDRRYTYRDDGLELRIGDHVEVPVRTGLQPGTVVEMGSTYTGPVKSVIRRSTPIPTVLVQPAQPTTGLGRLLQRSIERVQQDKAPHIIGMARAGTGKTTTGEEGLKLMRGMTPRITPSPQQEAIWNAMQESKDAQSIAFTAFGKDIAVEVQDRLRWSGLDKVCVEGLTTHSMGFKAVRQAFELRDGDIVNGYVVQDHLAKLLCTDPRALKRAKPILVNAVDELVGLCKQTLNETDPDSLLKLSRHFGVEFNNPKVPSSDCTAEVLDLVPAVLELCKDPSAKGQIDFNDMCWLPVVHRLPGKVHDFMIVDEAQDLNRARQEIVKMYGRRLMLVGDDRQAIFGFAGADAESMKRMEKDLAGDRWCPMDVEEHGEHGYDLKTGLCSCGVKEADLKSRDCHIYPLTVTRRCGKAIVEEARQIVPDFEAHPSNPEGLISHLPYTSYKSVINKEMIERPVNETYLPHVKDGDRILCRYNGPLISQYFKLIRLGMDATILGKDIGQGLIKLVDKLGGNSIPELIRNLCSWEELEVAKEQAEKNPSETRITNICDKVQAVRFFIDGAQTVADVRGKMEQAFADKRCPRCRKGFGKEALSCWNCKVELVRPTGVQLSSIHKAKGLEAQRVFFLQPPGIGPRRDKLKGWELTQEDNLLYVGITRAIGELCYVR